MKFYSKAAVFILIGFAAVFESVRDSLYMLGQAVGGVGGVGGLTNQYAAVSWCNHTAAYTKLYCFAPGVLGGLTPYAVITTLFWISPLLILATGGIIQNLQLQEQESSSELNASASDIIDPPLLSADVKTPVVAAREDASQTSASQHNLSSFKLIWALLSLVWFANPLCAYLSSPFYQESVTTVILAVALAASFPLSWSAMLVALPMTSATGGGVIGMDRLHVREMHIHMASWTGLWVLLHGGGEIIYLAATKTLWSSLSITHDGENMLYVFGLITLCFGVAHAAIALLRRHWYSWFRRLHLPLALLLLVLATIHWWPFAFFMLPAASAHAFERAKRLFCESSTPPSLPADRRRHQMLTSSVALLAAICSALVVLGIVWYGRQVYMETANANRYIPFVFAGASLVLSFLGAFAAACAVFALEKLRDG